VIAYIASEDGAALLMEFDSGPLSGRWTFGEPVQRADGRYFTLRSLDGARDRLLDESWWKRLLEDDPDC
jgi:hypothetical protein